MSDYKPVVGEEIEYELHSYEDVWYEAVAVCEDLGGIVFRNENGNYFNSNDNRIRPIRSQEEKDREEAIEILNDIVDSYPSSKSVGEVLYDADYRLVGGKVDQDELSNQWHEYKWSFESFISHYDIFKKVKK